MNADLNFLPSPPECIELDIEMLWATPVCESKSVDTNCQFDLGGWDEFQMRAEVRAQQERKAARARHSLHLREYD